MDPNSPLGRFVALVRRELSAADVRVLDATETAHDVPNVISAKLPDARTVIVTFDVAPEDREVRTRRLAMLVGTFQQALGEPDAERFRPSRTPVTSSLHDELRALATRARALDVVVIDANSPIVWGSALGGVRHAPSEVDEALRDMSGRRLVEDDDDGRDDGSGPEAVIANEDEALVASVVHAETTLRAIKAVRALPGLSQIHKGKHLRHAERSGTFYLALSFSGIYVLVLVFDESFDELRAERTAHEAMPRVERLVLALPPHDPDPEPAGATGQVVSLRRARRR